MTLTDLPGPPCLLWHSPVYTFHQHRKLRPAQIDLTLTGCGPHKPTPLKALGEQTRPLAIPPDHLDLITAPSFEQKQMAGKRIARQNLFALCRQPVKSTPHIRHARSQPDLGVRNYWDHAASPRASSRTKPASTPSLTRSLRPFSSVISI